MEAKDCKPLHELPGTMGALAPYFTKWPFCLPGNILCKEDFEIQRRQLFAVENL